MKWIFCNSNQISKSKWGERVDFLATFYKIIFFHMYIYTAKGYPFFLFATFVTFQSKVNQISNKEEKKILLKKDVVRREFCI